MKRATKSGPPARRDLFAELSEGLSALGEARVGKRRLRYTREPLGKLKVVPNFLPAPEDLVFREEGIKVTLALSKRSVEFFKREAAKHNTQYQRMIRRLLDAYAEHHAQRRSRRTNDSGT